MDTQSQARTAELQALDDSTLLDFYTSRVRFDHYDPFGAEADHGFSQDELREEILARLNTSHADTDQF